MDFAKESNKKAILICIKFDSILPIDTINMLAVNRITTIIKVIDIIIVWSFRALTYFFKDHLIMDPYFHGFIIVKYLLFIVAILKFNFIKNSYRGIEE